MSKKGSVILGIICLLIIVAVILFLFSDDIRLAMVKSKFLAQVNACEEIEFIESQSATGKLNGNGNGKQFFCAVLVYAESEETVKTLANELDQEFESVGYSLQNNKTIDNANNKYLEHASVSFEKFPQNSETCYVIYLFDTQSKMNLGIVSH